MWRIFFCIPFNIINIIKKALKLDIFRKKISERKSGKIILLLKYLLLAYALDVFIHYSKNFRRTEISIYQECMKKTRLVCVCHKHAKANFIQSEKRKYVISFLIGKNGYTRFGALLIQFNLFCSTRNFLRLRMCWKQTKMDIRTGEQKCWCLNYKVSANIMRIVIN